MAFNVRKLFKKLEVWMFDLFLKALGLTSNKSRLRCSDLNVALSNFEEHLFTIVLKNVLNTFCVPSRIVFGNSSSGAIIQS